MDLLKIKYFILLAVILISCKNEDDSEKPSRWLEDISYNKKKDNPNFSLCNGEEKVYQYFNLGDNIEIEGDKSYILDHFKKGYDSNNMPGDSGLIRIRFIVNCKGETDRYRILESDLNYNPKKINKNISKNLIKLTKSLTGWKQKFDNEGNPVDYYQYLLFRIENGKIVKILP